MGFVIRAACLCHTGYVRSNNEDNFYFRAMSLREEHHGLTAPLTWEFTTEKRQLLALFDGLGGLARGETAAFTAAQTLHQLAEKQCDSEELFLNRLARGLNLAVHRKSRQIQVSAMGATLALLCFLEDQAYSCNLGDSRVYRLRQRELAQLSRDHTTARAEWNLYSSPRLTQYLGMNPEEFRIEPGIRTAKLEAGDVFLLCTDGLSDVLKTDELHRILEQAEDPAEAVAALVEQTLAKGGRDNVTAIVCKVM